MEVNRQWWDGTAREFYVDGTVGKTPIITTCPNLETSVRANLSKYQGVEWDKSICPWKINHNSDFFKFQWANPYYKTGVSGTTMAQSPLFKERKKGYTFYISAAGGSGSHMPHEIVDSNACTKPLWKTCLSNDELDLTNTDINYWYNLKYRYIFPVINFDYSRIFVAPMIHTESGSGWLFHDDAQIRADWDSTGVYGISLMFYGKSSSGGAYPICAGLFSLNNKFAQPAWDTTNCWKEETMFDNALAVAWSNAWDGGQEVGGIQTVGSNVLWGTDEYNPGFADQTFVNENAAGAVMYFPMKNIMIQTPADTDETIWSTDWDHFYLGGGYTQGTKRHLKSGITYDEFADYLKKQLAYLGFRFCIDANHLKDDINSQYFFIPVIDENGVTTGNYYTADSTEAQNLPNNSWNTNVYEQTPYDGTDDVEDDDPNNYDETNTTILNTTGMGIRFQNYYIVEPSKIVPLIGYLYSDLPTNQPLTDYLTNNPIDCVVSFMQFPFEIEPIKDDQNPTGEREVFFGKVNSHIYVKGLTKSLITLIDCGECTYYSPFGAIDFRSYEPYYTAEIYLPYCGNVKLNPSIFLNANNTTKIKVKYLVDLITGACIAMVYRDNLVVEMSTGQIGVKLPITGVQCADLQRDITNKQSSLRTSRNTALASVAKTIVNTAGAVSGSPAEMVGAFSNVMSSLNSIENNKIAQYNIEHVQVPYNVKGGASPLTDYAFEQFPRITFRRPVMLPEYEEHPEIYAHSVGYACIISDTISNYSGYAEITGVDLSGIVATDEEKVMIKNYLESGVYL